MNTSCVKNRRIRITLLKLLKTEYPSSLDLKALQFALDNLGYPMPDSIVRAHLKYLEEKGLAVCTRKKGFGFSIAFASLTARGWDYLDGYINEQGVDKDL